MVNCQTKYIDKRLIEGKYSMYKVILYSDEKQTIEEIFNQHMPYITKNYFKIITISSDLENRIAIVPVFAVGALPAKFL